MNDMQTSSDVIRRCEDELAMSFGRSVSEDMPRSPYQDFCLWSLSMGNPARSAWLQIWGIPQFVKLTLAMFDGILDGQHLEEILRHSVPMNVYLMYETMSDNLSIGLGGPIDGDGTRALRRGVVDRFNSAMVERLRGNPKPARALLDDVAKAAAQISCTQQSLNAGQYEALARAYVARGAGVSLHDLEHSIWPQLVANIETCARVARHVEGYRLGSVVRWGLVNRYRAVSLLLDEPDMSMSRRAFVSTDAILVIPTLAYYVGVLTEAVCPVERLSAVVDDGTLGELLFLAALLVRLLNDLGTKLLQSTDERVAFVEALRRQCACAGAEQRSFAALLRHNVDRFGSLLTRLDKDIAHGEVNVALHGLTERPAAAALSCFEQRLEHLALLFSQSYQRFNVLSNRVSADMGDDRASKLVRRFVQFHERLYSRSYTSPEGEYAI